MSFLDDEPRKTIQHQIGQDLSLLSLTDIDARIETLRAEIERLQAERRRKETAQSMAAQFFKD